MKTKINTEKAVEYLTNFLNNISENKDLFVYSVNLGKNTKFAVAEKLEHGAINALSNFMTYDEMNCYFFGVMAVKQNKIKF